ncbi:TM0106 family RecB-like putative nuclease [Leucobacter allii]|uniref:TM0106 family RecB-like putative nuclease n=1 Tax=Leucobacter allii TaxID=2932247 RepID=UPI001FD4645C|nr:bifunctional RecB family nuclease/DEAD/DEAH box helicase [Leucobacter allii]UOR00446.1 TM0106 family RecB-like putative nuclease [Leucobacter allii]
MFVQDRAGGGRRLVTSASDLTAASVCEFAFLRRVDARLGRDVAVPPDDDPMLARAARLGDAHEARTLDAYRDGFGAGTAGERGGVVEIPRPGSMGEADLERVAAQTLRALHGGAEIVFQATFFEPAQRAAEPGDAGAGAAIEIGFVGFADFLRRDAASGGAYEVQDTKLARRAKVTALMQLAAYAEQLERLGVPVTPEAELILGDGARSRHRLTDIAPVFRARRLRLHRILRERAAECGPDGTSASAAPVAWGAEGIAACGRCEVCAPEVKRTRDPLLIAGLSGLQRDRLRAAGYPTIDAVAALASAAPSAVAPPGIAPSGVVSPSSPVPGMSAAVVSRIALQAAVQLESSAGGPPAVRVVDPSALAALPEPDPGDLFFDFEGDPLYREADPDGRARWGIDYLFGMVDERETFTPIWAHDLAAERRALERFLALVEERRRAHPGMHIYHYAAYERTHLTSIAARHGIGEEAVDRLLAEHVLVDLYPIVRRALRVGSRSYSIKKLEPLYMGERLRDEAGVTSGAQSVGEYAEASALLRSNEPAEREEGARRMHAIAEYNAYDCVSTLRLRDWLRGIADAHGVAHAPEPEFPDAVAEEPAGSESPTAVALRARAESAERNGSGESAGLLRLAASAVDYHRREQKSFWWAHYARLVDPIEDWADTRDVLVASGESTVELDWHRPPRARVDRRAIRLRGEIAPGSSGIKPGAQLFAVYERPAPFANPGAAPGARATRLVRVAEVHENGATIEETLPADGGRYAVLPVALTPGPPPRAGSQKGAIEEWGNSVLAAPALDELRDPVLDLLRRTGPRLRAVAGDGGTGESEATSSRAVDAGASPIDTVVATLRRLDRSALAVQGPPGTGKTYLAARVIARLVAEDGWHVGVVAQSHRVVEHVLDAVADAGLDESQIGKSPQGGRLPAGAVPPRRTVLPTGGQAAFVRAHRQAGRGSLTGGTAWDFSHEERFPRRSLDLIVIDEAGQFSIAPTIAAASAAERLLLLGDPQQLPQVSQGTHPEPVDASALGWLLGEHDTLPTELGCFLAETRRLRPELAEIVSELSYDGRLRAHPTASLRTVRGAGPAGLVHHAIAHRGNATRSPEEAVEVVRIVRELLGGASISEGAVAAGDRTDEETTRAAGGARVSGGLRGSGIDSGREAGAVTLADAGAVAVSPPGAKTVAADPPAMRDGDWRPLDASDLVVVAAYNAQVECVAEALAAAGLERVRVGTVDRFQGQEAVVAIVTLAASSPEDVPRGLEFLLMRNRLNVAISRAQWSAHLVSSDRLGQGLPTSAEGLAALSGYLRLLERGARATVES